MKLSDFDYHLPPELIAQHPAAERDASRMLVLGRVDGSLRHATFRDLPEFLGAGDLLIVNDTRVLPARLFARVPRAEGGDREVEILLLREEPNVPPARVWSALARPARALREGTMLAFHDPSWRGRVISIGERGVRRIEFEAAGAVAGAVAFEAWLSRVGHVPLPPYIERTDEPSDRERYQTVFANETGSVAAPTAGLHFTDATLAALHARGVAHGAVTLHVGPGTFRPVTTERPEDHVLDPEPYRVPPATAAAIVRTKAAGGRVIAVGTTSVRTLEAWSRDGRPGDGAWRETGLFVLPPFEFQVVDAMITNFHLPRSSLLFLVSAFAGRELIREAYDVAVAEKYRFYSYGDAMLIS